MKLQARLNYWDELKQFACCFEDDINDKDPQTIAEDDNSDEKQKILSHFHQKEIVQGIMKISFVALDAPKKMKFYGKL